MWRPIKNRSAEAAYDEILEDPERVVLFDGSLST
jgi:hypothetical protein